MSSGDLLALGFMTILLVAIAIFVTEPLLKKKPENVLQDWFEETPFHDLLSKKNSLYAAIKELEFDYKTAKLSDEDYRDLKEKLELEAVAVLKQIDKITTRRTPKKAEKKISVATATLELYCNKCGSGYQKGDQFCSICGSALA